MDATLTAKLAQTPPAQTAQPKRDLGGPVLISDCVTPCLGTTLLQHLWQRDLDRLENER